MRTLNNSDVESLLSNFPTTRLSYEVSVHKNDNQVGAAAATTQVSVPKDSKCFIIPKGRRCIAWATEWNRKKIFAIIEVQTQRNQIPVPFRKFHESNGWYPGPVHMFDTCFHSSLTYGTVFGGVLFRTHRGGDIGPAATVQCFSINHVYWYKGSQIPNLTLSDHVELCENIFKNDQSLRQVAYTQSNSIIFGLPVLYSFAVAGAVYDDEFLQSFPYPVYSILYRSNTTTRVYCQNIMTSVSVSHASVSVSHAPSRNFAQQSTPAPTPTPVHTPAPLHAPTPTAPAHSLALIEYIKPDDDALTNIHAVFIVRPNVQNDIYELFVSAGNPRNGTDHAVFHNFAHIPNFKTSVMMNRLFRNIRENERLDTMEESETEEEFENIELDKYVSLHKEYKLLCRLNKKFCRWVPISVAPVISEVVNDFIVKQHESRYNIAYRRSSAAVASLSSSSSARRPFARFNNR